MKNFCFIVEEQDEGQRLDKYLSEIFPEISRSKIQNLVKGEKITINKTVKKSSYSLRSEDEINVEIEEEKEPVIPAQDIKLDIVYEDENMLVVNKPSGMLTHPTASERENTLVNALLFKYGDNLSDVNGYLRRGILHRLDRNTSGLLMVAKNNEAHELLATQIKERTAVKKYLAVVKGNLKNDSGVLDFPIARHPKALKMAVVEGGKPAITYYKVLERFKDATYLELDLKTGRTHQIRVHLSYIKHPIVNDSLYGGVGFKVQTQEQVLQSYKLEFTKPFTDDIIKLKLEPDDKIQKVLNYLKNKH